MFVFLKNKTAIKDSYIIATNKLKILNDPVYGFIRIPNSLIFDIIEHPYFQRLRRISQMGFSNLVYPGANHTRFHHAVGCLDLMQKTVRVLRAKGIDISEEEENGLCVAILLHDIGHGPFSHALEHSIVSGIHHEDISLLFMNKLNEEFKGALDVAIAIFTNKYPRKFLHQLISGQLDIDRLDYLKRDSFYTGVVEGNISSERLITMMNVIDDELVIDKKGAVSVEKFLISRSFMYWQVYLHKTGLSAEFMLGNILKRAKTLSKKGVDLFGTQALQYFLKNDINAKNFSNEVLDVFAKLDDYDLLSAIKEWTRHEDRILSMLSQMIVDRNLLKIELEDTKISEEHEMDMMIDFMKASGFYKDDAKYFVFSGKITNQAYNKNQSIKIVNKKGKLQDITKASKGLNLQPLLKPITKYFICYPKSNSLA